MFYTTLQVVKMFIGVSGPYNLSALKNHLHHRGAFTNQIKKHMHVCMTLLCEWLGLDSSILNWICQGDLSKYSPTEVLHNFAVEELRKYIHILYTEIN